MQIPLIVTNDNIYSFYRSFGRSMSLNIGDVVKAEILNVMSSGGVTLRITQPNGDSGIITARSGLPLSVGSQVFLKVAGGDSEIRLQLVATASEGSLVNNQPPRENIPAKLFDMLSMFSKSKLTSGDMQTLKETFAALPEKIKTAFPEFRAIDDLMPGIEKINSELLKQSVEDSGVLFETKLKLVSQGLIRGGEANTGFVIEAEDDQLQIMQRLREVIKPDDIRKALNLGGAQGADVETAVDTAIKNVFDSHAALLKANVAAAGSRQLFNPDSDQKALLLKIASALKDDEVIATLKSAGIRTSDVAATVDKLIRHVEFFQLSSKVNDLLYTFLPVTWQEMRDGDITFKEESRSGSRVFTCDINLDLAPMGKLSVSVTLFEGSYHISFYADEEHARQLIDSGRGQLEQRFSEGGLPLRVINVSGRRNTGMGVADKKGLDIRV